MKIFLLLILVYSLYAKESCYTVQLLSQPNSDSNRNSLLEKSFDDSCKMMEIGKSLTVRCGCFTTVKEAKTTLPNFKEEYQDAYVTSTYKSRFGESVPEKEAVIKVTSESTAEAEIIDKSVPELIGETKPTLKSVPESETIPTVKLVPSATAEEVTIHTKPENIAIIKPVSTAVVESKEKQQLVSAAVVKPKEELVPPVVVKEQVIPTVVVKSQDEKKVDKSLHLAYDHNDDITNLDFSIMSPVGSNNSCTTNVRTLLDLTSKNYPSIQAAKQMILGAEAQVEGAMWNYFPTPSVDFSQRSDRNAATLRLEQPLWMGGRLGAQSDYADSKYSEAKFSLGESRYLLTEKFLNTLQKYIQSEGELKGFREGKAQLEKFAAMLNRRISAGVSSQSDKDLLNSRIAQINADFTTAESNYKMARAQLELLIGAPLECAISFTDDTMLEQNRPLEEMKTVLLQTHPTLKKLQASVAVARAEKKGADAAIMPSFAVRAEHQNGSLYYDDTEDENMVYLSVTYNSGAGLSALSNIKTAKYKILQTQEELRTKEFELLDPLVADYADYHSAQNRLENIEETISSSQSVLESYTRLFIAGKRQWLDLVNTSREVTQNEISLAILKGQLIVTAYRLALQTGSIDFETEGIE